MGQRGAARRGRRWSARLVGRLRGVEKYGRFTRAIDGSALVEPAAARSLGVRRSEWGTRQARRTARWWHRPVAREGRRRRTFASMDRSPLRRVGSIGISRPAGQHGPPAPCRRVLCRGRVRVSEAVQWGREGRLAEGGGGPRDWSGGPVVSGNAGDSRERAAGRRAKRGAVGCGCSRREEGTAQHAPPRRSLCAR